MPDTVATIDLPLGSTGADKLLPRRYVVGADDTLAVELPGGFPGTIAYVTADGQVTKVPGLLAADAPLRFFGEGGRMRAESFDGKVVYQAVERVTAAVAWTDASPSSGCCGWWEHTLWRADPRQPGAGLLRAVTPPARTWSVIDFHLPGSVEPGWRIRLTDGKNGVVAAGVAPGARLATLVLSDKGGATVVQAHDTASGEVRWSTPLSASASEWRSGQGQMAHSSDGAYLAVLVESPKRCESCSAIEIFETASGDHVRRIELAGVVSVRYSRLGITAGTVWVFEYVPHATTDLSVRPTRCQYEAYDITRGQRLPEPSQDWRFESGRIWGLAPHPAKAGVVALGWRGGKLLWQRSDAAP